MQQLNHIFHEIAVVLVSLSFVLALFSLLYYSSFTIKLICLEVLANLLVTALSLWSLFIGQPLVIDVCLAIALIMFVSTVAYCHFILSGE